MTIGRRDAERLDADVVPAVDRPAVTVDVDLLEVPSFHGPRITHRERIVMARLAERPPEVQGVYMLGLWHVVAVNPEIPLPARVVGVVHVHAVDIATTGFDPCPQLSSRRSTRRQLRPRFSDDVVERERGMRAGELSRERAALFVIDLHDFQLIIEVPHAARRVMQFKAAGVQSQTGGATRVAEGDRLRRMRSPRRYRRSQVEGLDGASGLVCRNETQRCSDGIHGDAPSKCGRSAHPFS